MTILERPVSSRLFGVELEVIAPTDDLRRRAGNLITAAGVVCAWEGYGHRIPSNWKIVTDGSLPALGLEIVSPPMSGSSGFEQIVTVCKVLSEKGFKVNAKTGLHVHHEVRDLDLLHWKALVKRVVRHEETVNQFMPASRHNTYYCLSLWERLRSWRSGYTGGTPNRNVEETFALVDGATCLSELRDLVNGTSRYYLLNLMAFTRQQTVEFRQHAGTMNAEKVLYWTLLTQAFIEDSIVRPYVSPEPAKDELANLMRSVPASPFRPHATSFYKKRIEEIATPPARARRTRAAPTLSEVVAQQHNPSIRLPRLRTTRRRPNV